jgi:serine/threonine-protein kinase HipA
VNIEIFELWNQSREILKAQTGADTSQPVDLVYQFGSTAGGARPKATVLYNEKTTDFMIQSKESIQKGFFPWLIKFDGFSGKTDTDKTPQPYERMEYIYSLMANDAGIEVPKTSYFEENGGLFHFLVKRFDRDLEPEYNSPNIFKIKKYHLQTLSALLHNDHNNQRSLDYDIALRYCLAITCDQSQVVEAYRRMVFNVLSHNRDDHSKNHSYIMNSNGQWSLSPSYDNVFCSPEATWFSKGHQITVNGKATDISFKDLEEIAKKHNVDSYRDLIDQVADAVSGWRNYAKKYLPGFDDYTNYVENRLKNVRVK